MSTRHVVVEGTDKGLLQRTAAHLEALADELTDRIALRTGRERDMGEQRAKYYRLAHDLLELSR